MLIRAGPAGLSSPKILQSKHFGGPPRGPSPVLQTVIDAVNNNLNSPEAFAMIDNADLSLEDWQKVDELFGLNLLIDTPDIDDEVRDLIFKRQVAREDKNWAESDRLRDLLATKNIGVKDTPAGPIWEYLR